MKDSVEKRQFLRPGDKWDKVKIDLKDIGTKGVGWIVLPRGKNKYQNFVSWQWSWDYIKCGKFLDSPRYYQLFKKGKIKLHMYSV